MPEEDIFVTVHMPPLPESEGRPLASWDWDPMEERSLDQLPFGGAHKAIILEYAAAVLWRVLQKINPQGMKSYDPLEIHGNVAWSYVFELKTDGRLHPFTSLEELEQALIAAGVRNIKRHYDDPEEL